MWKVGSVIIPTSAVVLLSCVTGLLLILLIMLCILNKVCCFEDCQIPAFILKVHPTSSQTDSESEDSDEEVFNNYSQAERTSECAWSRKASHKDSNEKEDPFLENWEKETLNDSKEASAMSIKSGSLKKRIMPIKTSVVRINVSFDSFGSKLKIQIMQVFQLAKSSCNLECPPRQSISDSQEVAYYQVHCSVLPNKKYELKTKLRKGPDPLFNEAFSINKTALEDANQMSLKFLVYVNQRSSMQAIGECLLDLSSIDLTVDSEYNLTMTEPTEDENLNGDVLSFPGSELLSLKSTQIEGNEDVAEVQLGLLHNSNTGRLTVEIIRGINLSKEKNKDFFVKLSLFSTSGTELSHAKTSVRKNTIAPVFKESFMFQVALFQLNEVTLMISVYAKKSIHRKNIIGWIALGYRSSGEEEISHWNEIKQGHFNQIVRSHRLHQNSNAKKILE